MKGIISLFCILFLPLFLSAQIDKAEYYIDKDPGLGNGFDIPFAGQKDSVDFPFNISLGGTYPVGFHTLNIRFKDVKGKWGLTESRSFFVTSEPFGGASKLISAEYFFDKDPGFGKGTSLTISPSGDSIDINSTIPVTGLPVGHHELNIRVKDASNKWSLLESRGFYINDQGFAPAPKLASAEYFFDLDPGVGKGTPFTLSSADSVSSDQTISVNGLPPGDHILYVRVKDVQNHFSLTEGRPFFITQPAPPSSPKITSAEYFFDKDPGLGKGISLNIGNPSDSVSIDTDISTNGLKQGMHLLVIRMMDAKGKWSLAESRNFQVSKDVAPATPIVSAEYFFDSDPGVGKGIPMTVSEGDSISKDAQIIITGLAAGSHTVNIRMQDKAGAWSLTESRPFVVCSARPIADFVVPKSICVGAPVTFADSSKAVDASANYKWDINNDNKPDFTTKGNLSYTYSAVGPYSVKLKVDNGFGCVDSIIKQIEVSPLPVVTVSALGSVTFCDGNDVTLTTQAGYAKYSWSNGDTTQNIVVKKSGNYNVTVTNTGGCKGTSGSKTITVKASPLAYITANNDTSFCLGDSVKLSANVVSGAKYLWSNGAITTSTVVRTSAAYSVLVTASNGCSTNSLPIVVTAHNLPVATISSNKGFSICDGDSVQLSTTTAKTYTWSTGETTQSIIVKNAGNYSVILVNGNNCVDSSGPAQIVVRSKPVVGFNYSVNGLTAQFVNKSFNANSYVWDFADGGSSTLTAPSHNFASVTSYLVKLKASNANNCTDSITIPVSLSNVMVAGKVLTKDNTPFKAGKVILARFNPAAKNYAYTDTAEISVTGAYLLTDIEPGIYILLAKADTNQYKGTFPTYYGDTTLWTNAKVLVLTNNSTGLNIHIKEEKKDIYGPGRITGIVREGLQKTQGAGSPLKGILVSLVDNTTNQPLKFDVTGTDGVFLFENIPYGNYHLIADLTGIPVDSITFLNYFTITPFDTIFDNLTVIVDSSLIHFEPIPTAIAELARSTGFSLSKVYPNPASDVVFVEIENASKSSQETTLQITDLRGMEVLKQEELLVNGMNSITLNTSSLANGVYMLSISGTSGKSMTLSKVIILR